MKRLLTRFQSNIFKIKPFDLFVQNPLFFTWLLELWSKVTGTGAGLQGDNLKRKTKLNKLLKVYKKCS